MATWWTMEREETRELSFVRRERTAANDGAQLNEIGTKEKECGANFSN